VVPIELSSRLLEAVPVVVDKVPSATERVRREIVLARFLGKLVVDQGVRELRTRLMPDDDDTSSPGSERTVHGPNDVPDQPSTVPDIQHDSTSVDGADAETLALADYDHLSSAQIVAKLDGLDRAERDAIANYERAGRHRRTILGKLDQLSRTEAGS
jgi:hypothetical protein